MTEQAPKHESSKTKEIERKFIIDPETAVALGLEEYPSEKIDQGYLVSTPECAIRIRRKGDKYYWTHKSAPTGHAAERVELETEITQEQFDVMWPGTEGRRVEKTRFEIPLGDGVHTIELDVFDGDNAGHVLAEVEFASTAEADTFQVPGWFGKDVTADRGYGNASIAERGFPEPYLT